MRRTKQIMSLLNKIDVVMTPRGTSKGDARYVNQMNQLINNIHANKTVAVWSKNIADTLTKVHQFGPGRYFSVNMGGGYYYIVKYYAYSNLKPTV